ncbi:SWPV1-298 [Shearwaterpox virus]|uniref:SWPV1-298 n=1 Tax=Shearwaterpox virus TaxID=1974596 RepID=A0A1V0S8B9_CNPV|nr:SWPV1-298 [Shearwaterpox virus]
MGEYNYRDLHNAVSYSYNEKVIAYYISKGYDVNEYQYGMQPIHHASRISRDFKTIKLLLDHGANINSVDNIGKT